MIYILFEKRNVNTSLNNIIENMKKFLDIFFKKNMVFNKYYNILLIIYGIIVFKKLLVFYLIFL